MAWSPFSFSHSSSPPPAPLSSFSPACVPTLSTVRLLFFAFLDPWTAARLMQVSRACASLLRGYTFPGVLQMPSRPSLPTRLWQGALRLLYSAPVVPPLRPLFPVYERYGLRLQGLRLTPDFNEPLIDPTTGRCRLPPSLQVLITGAEEERNGERPRPFGSSLPGLTGDLLEAQLKEEDKAAFHVLDDEEAGWQPHHHDHRRHAWPRGHTQVRSSFNQALLPGSLPAGLVRLQLNDLFYAPITPGALPPSLLELEFSTNWCEALVPGVFPANLRRLVLSHGTDAALRPGVLPSSLRFLSLGPHAQLQVGSLPEGLRGLHLRDGTNNCLSPGVLPSTLTLFRSGGEIRTEEGDYLPSGLLYLVCLASEGLVRVGGLPSSLRAVSLCFGIGDLNPEQQLTEGVIPHGVELVELVGYNRPLAPAVLPSSVSFVRLLGGETQAPLVKSSLPTGVRWVRLSKAYEAVGMVEEGCIPPAAQVEYEEFRFDEHVDEHSHYYSNG